MSAIKNSRLRTAQLPATKDSIEVGRRNILVQARRGCVDIMARAIIIMTSGWSSQGGDQNDDRHI